MPEGDPRPTDVRKVLFGISIVANEAATLVAEERTLPREAQSLSINCGQTLRGCGVRRSLRPIQPRAIRGTRESAQTTEAGSQI